MNHLRNNFVIVILNYLNFTDTIECVSSILNYKYGERGIVIVDNGSDNGSYQILQKRYANQLHVKVIGKHKNEGFARGNNTGIQYARKKMHADFVFVVNNDTIFTDKNYFEKLFEAYQPGVGMIGSKIVLKNGKEQAVIREFLGFRDLFFTFLNEQTSEHGSSFDFPVKQGKSTAILHGCAILFTPDFFKYYKGFYKRTFLYREELILYLMCTYRNLRQVYVPQTSIFHKEDQSSEMSFQNNDAVKGKYSRESMKYVLWWKIKQYMRR